MSWERPRFPVQYMICSRHPTQWNSIDKNVTFEVNISPPFTKGF